MLAISFTKYEGRIFRLFTRNKKSYESKDWINFYTGWTGIRFTFGPASYFDNRWHITFSLGWGTFYIHLPIYSKWDECSPPDYGFYYYEKCFWICLGGKGNENGGSKIKCIHLPYDHIWVRTSNLKKDGTWEHETKGNRKEFYDKKWDGILWKESFHFTYVLKNGTVQNRIATLRVEEREWRQRWLKWTKAFATISKTINIDFNDEVGERTGSWKGGTTGCSYNMKHGELPEQTLRRMEKERKF